MIVGLAGYSGAGKDTVAKILCEHHGYEQRAFAGKLKDSVAALFNIPRDWVDNWKLADVIVEITGYAPTGSASPLIAGLTFREFLQRYGTEAHRDIFGNDFWVDALLNDAYLTIDKLVISDVRFVSEFQAIYNTSRNKCFWIDRPGTQEGEHPSEQNMVHWCDAVLDNNGTIEDLIQQVGEIVIKYEL